jgi:hypothetical protein
MLTCDYNFQAHKRYICVVLISHKLVVKNKEINSPCSKTAGSVMLGRCALQSIWCILPTNFLISKEWKRVQQDDEIIYQCKFLPFPTWYHGMQLASSRRQRGDISNSEILHAPAPHISAPTIFPFPSLVWVDTDRASLFLSSKQSENIFALLHNWASLPAYHYPFLTNRQW